MTSPHAQLLERDEVRQIPAADLIPGDLVVLGSRLSGSGGSCADRSGEPENRRIRI